MNLNELKEKLDKELINPNCFDLSGGLPDEKYCINKYPWEQWGVYYAERGNKNDEKLFDSESKACLYLYELLKKDPTTRLNY